MKTIKLQRCTLVLIFAFSACVTLCNAQEKDDKKIKIIRAWYNEINQKIDTFNKVTCYDLGLYKDISPERYSYEGAELLSVAMINLERFYNEKVLVKAMAIFQGGWEDLTSEYYFHDQKIFFVYKKYIQYHKHKSMPEFDPEKKTTLEDRFYFENDKMIRWIDSRKKIWKPTDAEFKTKEKQILSDAYLYKSVTARGTGNLLPVFEGQEELGILLVFRMNQ